MPVAPETSPDYPVVIAVQGADAREEGRRVGELLRFLRCSGVIACYGQAALLLHIVKDGVSGPYVDGLETPVRTRPVRTRPVRTRRCEPAGHVRVHGGDEMLVTTIHQAKGREWDVVIVGSLRGPDLDTDRRPRHLLVLTCSGQPHPRFRSIWERRDRWPDVDRAALARQRFGDKEDDSRHMVMEFGQLRRLAVGVGARYETHPRGWMRIPASRCP